MTPKPSPKSLGAQDLAHRRLVAELPEFFRVQDAVQVALPDALQSQRGNQRGAHATAVLRRQNLNGILLSGVLLRGPVQNLAERLGAAGLEVWVFVEHRAVRTYMARCVPLLDADGSHTTGRQARGTGAD